MNSLRKLVSQGLFLLLTFSFVIWGVPQITTITDQTLIEVGNDKISRQAMLKRTQDIIAAQQRENPDLAIDDAFLSKTKKQVVEAMVFDSRLAQFNETLGIRYSDEVIKQVVRSIPYFKNEKTGEFDIDRFQNLLASNALTPSAFHDSLRESLTRFGVYSLVNGPFTLSSTMARLSLVRARTEKRAMTFLTYNVDVPALKDSISEEDLLAYYESNKTAYQTNGYREISGILVEEKDVSMDADANAKEIDQALEAYRLQNLVPARRSVFMITLPDMPAAQAFLQRLEAGETFSDLALEQSLRIEDVFLEDIGEEAIIADGMRDAIFADDVIAGTFIGPMQTDFGVAIAQITTVSPATDPEDLSDIRQSLTESVSRKNLGNKLLEMEESMLSALDEGLSIEQVAQRLELDIKPLGRLGAFGRFTPDDEGRVVPEAIGTEAGSQLAQADVGAFTDPVLIYDPPMLGLLQVDAIIEPADISFEEARPYIEADILRERIREDLEAARQKISPLLEEQALERIAETMELEASQREVPFTADQQAPADDAEPPIDSRLRDQLFALLPGGKTLVEGSGGETLYVVRVDAVRYDSYEEQARKPGGYGEKPIIDYLASLISNELFDTFLSELEQRYPASINDSAIDRLFASYYGDGAVGNAG